MKTATAPAKRVYSSMRKGSERLKWKTISDLWDIEAQTAYERIPEWLTFFKVNHETIGFEHSISDLPKIEGSAIVIDKSMASTKYFEQLPELKNYHGTIICCDRALYTVLEALNGIRYPDYVCNLDSSPLCLSFFDRPDVKKAMDKMAAIFAVTTNTLTIRHYHGKRAFFIPYCGSWAITKALMQKTGLPFSETGGQVASFAYILAYNLGANPIGLFGITHSYDSLGESEYPQLRHKRIQNSHGVFWQDPVYEWYNEIFLSCIQALKKQGVTTVNCMQDGALYSKNVEDLSLKEFIDMVENQ